MVNINHNEFIKILKINLESLSVENGLIDLMCKDESLVTIYPKLIKFYDSETHKPNNYNIREIMGIINKYGIRYDMKAGYILYTLTEGNLSDVILTINPKMIDLYVKGYCQ